MTFFVLLFTKKCSSGMISDGYGSCYDKAYASACEMDQNNNIYVNGQCVVNSPASTYSECANGYK